MACQIDIPKAQIAEFCSRWQVKELALFGSAIREDFTPDSDIDLLVDFDPQARRSLFDLVRMKNELETIFGRGVDLVSRRGIEASRNSIRKAAILQSPEIIYAA